MITRNVVRWLGGALAVVALLLLAPGSLTAQTSTGSIRGSITSADGKAVAGAEIEAKNLANGVPRTTTSRSDGSYNLSGLVPAAYQLTVRHIGNGAQARQVVVQIGAVSTQDFALTEQAVDIGEIVVQGAATPETRTSEVATNITSAQIEKLPSASRNFLDLAALAPGITVSEDRIGGTSKTFSAGGQTADAVNIFIDGTSLKNDLTGGGVTGQDASKGNPFPRNAIQEYRVISQNFKAEYQKASSAVITATTKSGGNEWAGNLFFNYQDRGLVALDTFQRATKAANPGFAKPDYARYLGGFSAGGPIIRNKLHVFASYEGNYQNRSNLVGFAPPATGLFPALDTVNLAKYNGNFQSPFRESLVFGKLSYAVSAKSTAELSFSNRHETDVRDFGTFCCGVNSFQEAVNFRQNVNIGQFRYNYFSGAWLNEAKIDYSRFRRNPSPNTTGLPSRSYRINGNENIIGSNLSTQDFIQKRIGFRDDVTYSGFQAGGQHVIKLGANFDFLSYDVFKGNDETPRFNYTDVFNGSPYDYRNPYELRFGTGNAALNKKNNQLGIYLQDDWSPTPRLTINAGIRWDYESKMMNYDYKTPQDVIDTLTRYNDSLPNPLDLNRYISTGSNRKPFYGAFQPRLGFSYALDRENKTTIFGGFGIYYDRSLFDVSVDETLKLTHPTYTVSFANPDSTPGAGQIAWSDSYLTANKTVLDNLVHTQGQPEAWLIDSKAKVPKSREWNLGVRRLLGNFVVSVTYAGVRGVDQLALNFGNSGVNPDGSCCAPGFNTGAHGFSNFIYSTNDKKTWYDALLVQIDRPYRRVSTSNFGWGAGLAYTYAKRQVAGADGLGDLFEFPTSKSIAKHVANDEKSHVVANWILDVPYVFGIQFSGVITLGSGARQDIGCPPRFCGANYRPGGFTPKKYDFIIPGAWAYRNVDLRLRKDLPNISGTTIGVTADLYNAFNYNNFGCFDTGFGTPNPNLGKANCVVSDARRFQLGVEYNF